jgi:formate hydrogenlyase subunit 4
MWPDFSVTLLALGALANILMALLAAPFLQGVLRRVTARIQSRQGPPLLQPYYDLFKLLGKEELHSGVAPAMQTFAASLSLTTALAAACCVPMGLGIPMAPVADALLLVYLLTLSGISVLLGGLAAGSTYSLIGISREMTTMLALEPLFAITIIMAAVHGGTLNLEVLLSGAIYQSAHLPVSGLFMLLIMFISFQAFVGRTPFDIAEAETEIMEGALIEYSGPSLALFKLAHMIKLVVFSALFIGLFVPWGQHWGFPLSWGIFWLKTLALTLLVTLVAATHARLRMDQAVRFFTRLGLASMVALALAAFGW